MPEHELFEDLKDKMGRLARATHDVAEELMVRLAVGDPGTAQSLADAKRAGCRFRVATTVGGSEPARVTFAVVFKDGTEYGLVSTTVDAPDAH